MNKVVVVLLCIFGWGVALGADSQCVRCHTDLKGLVKLTLELQKERPKPAKSAETAGEG